jgi:glycosyltransferase involved in cell wall biosynthesis
MRVLALPSSLDKPEAYTFLGLKLRGVQLYVAGNPLPCYQQLLDEHNIPVFQSSPRSRVDIRTIQYLRSLIKEHNINLVHSFSANALSNALLASLGMRHLKHVTYRGTVGHLHRIDPSSWMTFLNPRISKIICVSNAVKMYLHTKCKIPESRLCTIYKGHDVSWYETKPFNRSELEIPNDATIITMVANMRKVKGLHVLLDALLLLKTELKEKFNVHTILIGNLHEKKLALKLRETQQKIPIHHLGFLNEPQRFVAGSDIFVLPSIDREGLPKSLIEAMSLNIPVISTNVGGIPELIHNEINGLLVPPSQPQELCNALKRMVENAFDTRRKFSLNALNTIKNSFNINRTVESTFGLYREIIF